MSKFKDIRVAALYQALDPPLVRGLKKTVKETRYHDIGADILFSIKEKLKISVVTPYPNPDPTMQEQWCFPDTEAGILEAISKGATHIWANTVLFASHPLQTSPKLIEHASKIHIIGQPPVLTEICDDKDYLNNFIRSQIDVPMPRSWLINETQDLEEFVRQNALPWPIVAKPVRGRASQGVKVCGDEESLFQHLREIFPDSPSVILEEFLCGEEATVAVMPPDMDHEDYWCLPPVIRFNHMNDVVPYTGDVPATSNSRAVTAKDMKLSNGHGYLKVSDDCKKVAKLLEVSSLIRIDVRRYTTDPDSEFALFDINMKPNLSGPGRPGREDKTSLVGLAAAEHGFDYPTLLFHMIEASWTLERLRKVVPVL